MWNRIILLLFVGAVVAEHPHAWQDGKEYNYLIRSRTLTALDKLADQYTGIILKALLTVQRENDETLRAKITNPQYAQIHTHLPNGWDTRIPDQKLELRPMPLTEKPFEIKIKHGVVRDLVVDKTVPTWELNMLKSIVSQLQVDTQGENAKWKSTSQVPLDEKKPYAVFKAMEDTVSGKCEVLYDFAPLHEQVLQAQPQLVPMPQLNGGRYIEILKTKNYKNCQQRMGYHFGISGETKWEPGANDNGDFLSKSTTSRIIISGDLKSFTIQSSVTTNKMFVSPAIGGNQPGMVISRMNLTLADVKTISEAIAGPPNPESTGNLVYTYNKPFSHTEQRLPGQPTVSQDSKGDSAQSTSMGVSQEENFAHDDSDGTSASSRSISSKEGQAFWQPKPQLHEAPDSPMLPYFVGYRGKSIQMAESVNPLQEVRKIIMEITKELQDPSVMPTAHTLEKFSILTSLIRTMSRKQMAVIDGEIPAPSKEDSGDKEKDFRKLNAWATFRDAVAQAGTGPALLTIKDWIKNKKISDWEAAEVVAHIPQHARTPTSEYIDEFFSMLKLPEVWDQDYLNASVLVSFTNLVREAQVNRHSLHNMYPVHSFGRLSSKSDKKVYDEYIPYLAEELSKAVKSKDGPKIQMYSIALGNIAHPKILGVFEPYLEGKIPVTTFQRLVMVRSLMRLAKIYPKTTRSVLFKLYVNTMDAHEIRCTAAMMLMMTNPPLSMLLRMAEFTHFDRNKQVNSAVKSSIENAARLQRPDNWQLAQNARIAKRFLKSQKFSNRFSKNIMLETYNPNNHLDYRLVISYIRSQDSSMLKDLHVALYESVDSFKAPVKELGYMLSGVKTLFFKSQNHEKNEEPQAKYSAEKIAKILGIKTDSLEKFEGNVFSDYHTFAFDEYTLGKPVKYFFGNVLQNGFKWNTRKFSSKDMTLAFPTETGLPFLYTLKTPSVVASVGKLVLDELGTHSSTIKADVRAVYAQNIQGRLGFFTPFDHQHFMSGVDINGQIKFPAKIELQSGIGETGEKRVQLNIRPRDEEKFRMIHFSVRPFTSKCDILKLVPVHLQDNTQVIQTKDVKSMKMSSPPADTRNFEFEVTLQIDQKVWGSLMDWQRRESSSRDETLPWHRFMLIDFFTRSKMKDNDGVTITSVVAKKITDQDKKGRALSRGADGQILGAKEKVPDSLNRRKELMNRVGEGIKFPQSYVLDLGLQMSGKSGSWYVLTVAYAHSPVDDKAQMLSFAATNLNDPDKPMEICLAAQSHKPRLSFLDYDQAYNTDLKMKYDVRMRVGNDCKTGPEVRLKVEKNRSQERLQYVGKSQVAQQCQQEMKQGNKILSSCRQTIQDLSVLDEMEFNMDFDKEMQPILTVANMAVSEAKRRFWANYVMDPFDSRIKSPYSLEGQVKYSPDLSVANVDIFMHYQNVRFRNIDMMDSGRHSLGQFSDVYKMKLEMDRENRPTCALDKTQAMTFDGRIYPLNLGKCSHVAMTTYPRENWPILRNERVSMVVRDTDGDGKQLEITLGDNEIRVVPTSNRQPDVYVNSKKIQYSSEEVYVKRSDNQKDVIEFEIYGLPNGQVDIKSQKYGIELTYDQERVQIKASDDYRNSLRGLCGNYDDQPENDFLSPENCVLREPEVFAASYAFTKQDCSGPAMENSKKISTSVCTKETIVPSDVISDREAGRKVADLNRKWGYHGHSTQDRNRCHTYRTQIVENPEEICFSTRPVSTCATGCSPTETKMKKYDLHCSKRNGQSEEMKKRVLQGANPDFSHKSVTRTTEINVPVNCKPNGE